MMTTKTVSVCKNKGYTFNGATYYTSGTYVYHYTSKAGCDSVVTLNLTVKDTSIGSASVSFCPGKSVMFKSLRISTPGTYHTQMMNKAMCDSFIVVTATYKKTSTNDIYDTVCSNHPIVFKGQMCKTSGIYTAKMMNSVGCDSIINLHVTVLNTSSSTTNASICAGQSYLFNGSNYSTPGIHMFQFTRGNKAGCDSTAYLNLTVNKKSSSSFNKVLCKNESFTYNGVTYTKAGMTMVHFTNINGCDSVVTLMISFSKSCKDGMADDGSTISAPNSAIIYPNPNNGQFVVDMSTESNLTTSNILVTDILGRVVMQTKVPVNNGAIHAEIQTATLTTGVYLVNVLTGSESHITKIIVQK